MQTFDSSPAANDEIAPFEDDLVSQATHWVVRLTSGDTTTEEREAFRRWRDASPAHEAALADARQLWLAIGPALDPAVRKHGARSRLGLRSQAGALAASLVICLLAGNHYLQTYGHDYVTDRGERRTVTLADGTQVMMGGHSALDVSFKNGSRRVSLARGEAYFDVVHDPSRPFSVTAGKGEVQDIGTAFSVRRNGDGAAVVVARGEVEVVPARPGAPSAKLTANQTVVYGAAGPSAVQPANAEEALSWTHGRLVLVNQSMADSVAEISRYYKGQLVLLDSGAGARRIDGVVDLNHIDDWLAGLENTHTVKIARVGALVILY
jgi:transmembrane sensor